MKIVKRILFTLVGLIMVVCLGILICALNPSLTDSIAQKLQAIQSGSKGGNADDKNRGTGVLPDGVPGVNVDWLADREHKGYLVPGQDPGKPPAAVDGRSGYTPVSEDAQQVLPEEADTVAPGELGEGLTFEVDFYPYYAMLEPNMQQLYNQIYANAVQLTGSFTPVVDAELGRVKRVFEAVYNDHPELFWLETSFSCKCLEDGTCVEITLNYNETVNDLSAAREMFLGQAENILSQARNLGSDYEREKYVHDALAERVEYDLGSRMNQSAYSGMVTARTVCAGYARAFQYLLQQLGIPCYYCTGYAGEDHAWNIVRLGGVYYNVDVTWDDTAELTYNYFNRTDAEYALTHRRTGLSVYLPACMGTDFRGDITDQNDGETGEQKDPEEDSTPQATQGPMRPLTWEGNGSSQNKEDSSGEQDDPKLTEEQRRQELERLGIAEDELVDTMDEYYADCKEQMKLIGLGEGQFSNVVPVSLWRTVEIAYSTGSYQNGYVNDILKDLGAEDFYVQLEIQNLGGGYYRIYHNVLTY